MLTRPSQRYLKFWSKLYGSLIVFVYHCFDRVVIHGYLSGLSRPEQVVYFFRPVLCIPAVSKEVLRQRTDDYRGWVEAYARNHGIVMEWAEMNVRKEDHVLPALLLFFHKRLCGPLANSRFHHKPDPESRPNSQLEAAYHKADKAIEDIFDLLQAA